MKAKKIVKSTTNRGEFNRAYKRHLERKGKIRCSYCKYHRGENKTTKHYGGIDDDITFPSWKLSTKNRKQWMNKNLKVREEKNERRNFTWTEIDW